MADTQHIQLKVSVSLDHARLDQIFERARARMRRLSRKERRKEWQHINRQIAECISINVGLPGEENKHAD